MEGGWKALLRVFILAISPSDPSHLQQHGATSEMVFLPSQAKEGIIIETSIVAPGAARKPGWSSWWLTEQATGLCDNRLCQIPPGIEADSAS